ncbi:helix-hairpin-helix domain-containing protein [Cecembia rubra]|uniref:Helix-hairpin-helix protein n=1 Tax=Cecembia rubra TaxID=1485585 RepID=A0A2P8DRL6_9BACT|nr:helix-hairpin-helix domain-containing protein [Cecembia rubra]PSK99863.1 helix-hairpin-helix protein [Cecembia rubra]
MNKIGFYILFLLLIDCFKISLGQNIPKGEIDIENFIEDIFGMQREEMDYEDLYEGLLQTLLNPINLNKTNPEELKSIFILNPNQINHFFEYKKKFGDLLSIYELQAIPEFDLETIYRLLPFVILEERNKTNASLWNRIGNAKDGYFIFRHRRVWETRRGFTPPDTLSNGNLTSRYLGDPNSLYGRFRIQQSKDFSLGFTIDKDPGEQFIWDPSTKRYGFNFLSYHFTLYNRGNWKAITIGDFQMQFGQGLVFGAGFSAGKGAETITTVRRSSFGIRPYTAALEFGFFRGTAGTYQAGPIQITVMASHAPRDANLQVLSDTLENETAIITSLQSSGLHRTTTEIRYKNRAREKNLGGNLHYQSKNKNFQMGINGLYTQFSQPFLRNPRIYNQFEFSGQNNHIQSIYFSYNIQNYYFFGESARSASGGMGSIMGMMSSLHPKLSFSLLWRDYSRNFHTFYGNAFGEGTRPINERGMYMGLNFKPNIRYNLSFYYDRFHFPWLRFRVYSPSYGEEWFGRFTYRPKRNTVIFMQVRNESKSRNVSDYNGFQSTYRLDQGIKNNFIFNLDHKLDRIWSLKSRVSASTFKFDGKITKGFAISQDLNADFERWRISSRISLFDTDDFDNRQFLYERNVLWLFSIPALHGQGMRYYLLTQYRLNRKLTFWLRFAQTIYTDRDIIGSGLQQIRGNTITETNFQLRYQFNR